MVDIQHLIDENRLLAETVKRRIDQLAAVNLVASSISQSLDLNQTLETALQAVLNVTGAEAGGISLIDEQAGEVVLRAQRGWMQDFVQARPMRIPLGRGMSGRVIDNDTVVVNNDLDEREQLAVPSFHEERFRSIAMAPMHARGRIIGILSIMSYRAHRFDEADVAVLTSVADTVGVALDNARLFEQSIEIQRQLSAVLESTADGIIATDGYSRIRLVNQAAAHMLDVNPQSLLGVPLREADIEPQVRESLLFALSTPRDRFGLNNFFRVTLQSGLMLSVLVSPISTESQLQGEALNDGWVIVLQDVTLFRQAETARTRFIQSAAHDMRNPLNAALTSLILLKRKLNLTDQEIWEIIGIAESSISRIQGLIDNLLQLEQMQSSIGFTLSEVNVGEMIEQIAADFTPKCKERRARLEIDYHGTPRMIYADQGRVMRAVQNYLDNALRQTHEGGSIILRVYTNDNMLHIEVQDEGEGIPVEAQARLFERFYRINARESGSGLGLAVVKAVAEGHGGRVYLQSKPGQGSIFGMTLRLPSS